MHGRGCNKLLALFAVALDDSYAGVKPVVLDADKQGGISRSQKASGRRKPCRLKFSLDKSFGYAPEVVVVDDSNNKFHKKGVNDA